MGKVTKNQSSGVFNTNGYLAFLMFYIISFLGGCSNIPEDFSPNPDIESNNNILACEYCLDFGQIIEFSGDQMVVAEYQNVYIYELENGIWKLSFELINQGTAIDKILMYFIFRSLFLVLNDFIN